MASTWPHGSDHIRYSKGDLLEAPRNDVLAVPSLYGLAVDHTGKRLAATTVNQELSLAAQRAVKLSRLPRKWRETRRR